MANMPSPYETDRRKAILTEGHREYLLGESDIEPQTDRERQVRRHIRDRTQNALLDFTLLFEHLEPRDRRQIFESDDDQPFRDALIDTIAFIYYRTNGNEVTKTLTWPSPLVDAGSGEVVPNSDRREDRNRQLTRFGLTRAALRAGIQIDEMTVFDDIQYSPSSKEGSQPYRDLLQALEEHDIRPADLARFIDRFDRNEIDMDKVIETIETTPESRLKPNEPEG